MQNSLRCSVSGIIPACAGSTCVLNTAHTNIWDHPRMCGEHLGAERTLSTLTGSSPHVRGALAVVL